MVQQVKDLVLLTLMAQVAAMAQFQSLPLELPHAMDAAKKKKNKKSENLTVFQFLTQSKKLNN